MARPTQERLRQLFRYEPDTGLFIRLVDVAGNAKAGMVAGSVNRRHGNILIHVDGARYFAHRLAWVYMTGDWPIDEIDHRDRDRANNRWANLREATRAQNNRNVGKRRDNKTGYVGVHVHRQSGKFCVQIGTGKEREHVGLFDCGPAAHFAYIVAANRRYGEFSPFAPGRR